MANNNQKLILDVPYYSQQKDVEDERWKRRACGIVCLKMVMEYFGDRERKAPSLNKLIKENEFIGGFTEFGSKHEALVILLRNYGINAYRQEFRSLANDLETGKAEESPYEEEMVDFGIGKISFALGERKPVIASVFKGFSERDKFHLIVLTGFEKRGGRLSGFYFNDPDYPSADEGKNRFVPLDLFKDNWRKMVIFSESGVAAGDETKG